MTPRDLKMVKWQKKACRLAGRPHPYPHLNTLGEMAKALGVAPAVMSRWMWEGIPITDQSHLEFLFNAPEPAPPIDGVVPDPDLRANPDHAPTLNAARDSRITTRLLHRQHGHKIPRPDYDAALKLYTQREMATACAVTIDTVKNWSRYGIPQQHYQKLCLLQGTDSLESMVNNAFAQSCSGDNEAEEED
jgi:hypothetical protein